MRSQTRRERPEELSGLHVERRLVDPAGLAGRAAALAGQVHRPVVVEEERRVDPAEVGQPDGLGPRAGRVLRGDEEVPAAVHVGRDHVERAGVVPERRSVDAARGAGLLQGQLALARQDVAQLSPVHQVAAREDRHAGEELEAARHEVEVVPHAHDARVGVEARDHRVAVGGAARGGEHRPVVGAEGRGRQALAVAQRRLRVVGPGVADGHGLRHGGRGDDDRLAVDAGLGPVPPTVDPRDGEALRGRAVRPQPCRVAEAHAHGAALDGEGVVEGAGAPRSPGRTCREAPSARGGGPRRCLFFGWMSPASPMSMATAMPVCGTDSVLVCASRSSAQALSPGAARARHVVRELHEEEGEVAAAPRAAPVADHRREEGAVLEGRARVALALVPDRPADGERRERGDHRAVEDGRAVRVVGRGVAGLGREVGRRRRELALDPVLPRAGERRAGRPPVAGPIVISGAAPENPPPP